MDRLIHYSGTIFPSKIHSNSSPPLPLLARIDAAVFKPHSPVTNSRRVVSSLFRNYEVSFSSPFAKFPTMYSIKPSSVSYSTPEDSPDGSKPTTHFVKKGVERYSEWRKAATAGTVVLLSALIVISISPVIVSPAFALFPNAANTGAPIAAAAGGKLLRAELLTSAWTGFFAGCLHTLSGPDHLAALAPLSIGRTRMESAAVGALWGCGHDAGQLLFGLLFLLLKDRLHIEIIRTWGTRVVGFTLLVIGAMGIREASEVHVPCVVLENGECDVSNYETFENRTIGKKKKKRIGFATFATGIVHGLQPDALMMVLPALALPSRLAGAAFLGMFLVGTVIAMGSYTVFIGSCSEALKERVPRITEKLTWASSLVAIALGLAIIITQFFGFSLY
ncbi:chloroplast protein FOR GROWTH AND FERTILITY 2-like [Rhododendron vialii]|uniref:chloroplast protein FOR GROWTH AND FERTILITY 2-like n=1 Tax=Rhododendron vialii TaxID=182163 RepID=UPI0026601AC2|nr:chloroplast protein FOR GROWTH AND FERTILITY 2-like [Rhododendron vialii]